MNLSKAQFIKRKGREEEHVEEEEFLPGGTSL